MLRSDVGWIVVVLVDFIKGLTMSGDDRVKQSLIFPMLARAVEDADHMGLSTLHQYVDR